MDLGIHYTALDVKDIAVSYDFYEKLGFSVIAGKIEENWLILRNGRSQVGLYQGMFPKNILVFNPSDARAVQAELQSKGIELVHKVDPEGEGPCFVSIEDPDGNPVLIDQIF